MKHPNDKAATPKADAMPSRGGSYHYDESGKHVRTVDPTKQPEGKTARAQREARECAAAEAAKAAPAADTPAPAAAPATDPSAVKADSKTTAKKA